MHELLATFWFSTGQQLHEIFKYCNWFIGTGGASLLAALEFESNYYKKSAMHDLLAHSGYHQVNN
jgi:hypothetical protein